MTLFPTTHGCQFTGSIFMKIRPATTIRLALAVHAVRARSCPWLPPAEWQARPKGHRDRARRYRRK